MSSADFWVGPPSAPQTYRLVSLLGGGGEGDVWSAELPLSTGGRRQVAVKILPCSGRPDEAAQWERFGHLLESLNHPGLVRVTNVFTGAAPHRTDEPASDPAPYRYVVMDHIDGPTLREWCDDNPDATASTRLRMLRMIASALDEMHAGAATLIPVAHGDVKPSNVIVRPDGGTVLVDLGLSRLTDGAGVAGHSAPYAAPELRTPGAMATPEADSYAFAATIAQVLTGQAPPTTPDGWLDVGDLETQLRSHPITQRRPALIKKILDVLSAPPEARPRHLRSWLDATGDAVSLITTSEATSPPAAAADSADSAENPTFRSIPAVTPTTTPPTEPARRRRRWLFWIIIPTVIVVVAAATVFTLEQTGAFGTQVQAEPIQTSGANPFMPPAGTDQTNVTPPAQMVSSQQPNGAPPAVSGDTQGLYGGTLNNASCNPAAMVNFLSTHPAQGAAWAGVEGISQADLPSYILSLTPVTLRTDTAVTNHGFFDGAATSLHSVLQAGTAVLVDNHGIPRARCLCGNPLTPPVRFSNETYSGPHWPTFAPQQIVVIQPAPVVIKVFVLVDVVTNIVINRPVGTDGDQDQLGSAALAGADIAGTYNVSSTTNSCTYSVSCGANLSSIQIDCTSNPCTINGPSGGALSRPLPIFRNGPTWSTSQDPDEAAATCNGQPIPGAMAMITLSTSSASIFEGHLKATSLRGTLLITSPAENGCQPGNASFDLSLSTTGGAAPQNTAPAPQTDAATPQAPAPAPLPESQVQAPPAEPQPAAPEPCQSVNPGLCGNPP